MTSIRKVSLNGGVYWMREKEGTAVKYLMSDGDHRGVEELCDDDLVEELEAELIPGVVDEKISALLAELKARLQDNLDTKALELAAKILTDCQERCPWEMFDWNCHVKEDVCDMHILPCWIDYLRQMAGEAA